eukprot:scaffold76486_cov21-Tisochrysis_lutea.AAC.1
MVTRCSTSGTPFGLNLLVLQRRQLHGLGHLCSAQVATQLSGKGVGVLSRSPCTWGHSQGALRLVSTRHVRTELSNPNHKHHLEAAEGMELAEVVCAHPPEPSKPLQAAALSCQVMGEPRISGHGTIQHRAYLFQMLFCSRRCFLCFQPLTGLFRLPVLPAKQSIYISQYFLAPLYAMVVQLWLRAVICCFEARPSALTPEPSHLSNPKPHTLDGHDHAAVLHTTKTRPPTIWGCAQPGAKRETATSGVYMHAAAYQ